MLLQELINFEKYQLDENLAKWLSDLSVASKKTQSLSIGTAGSKELPAILFQNPINVDKWISLPASTPYSSEAQLVADRLTSLAMLLKFGNHRQKNLAKREIESAENPYTGEKLQVEIPAAAPRTGTAKVLAALSKYVGQGYLARWADQDRWGINYSTFADPNMKAVHQGLYTFNLDEIWRNIAHILVPGLPKDTQISGPRNVPMFLHNKQAIHIIQNTGPTVDTRQMSKADVLAAAKNIDNWLETNNYAPVELVKDAEASTPAEYLEKALNNPSNSAFLIINSYINRALKARKPAKELGYMFKEPKALFKNKALQAAFGKGAAVIYDSIDKYPVVLVLNPRNAEKVESISLSKIPELTEPVAGYQAGVPTTPVKRN